MRLSTDQSPVWPHAYGRRLLAQVDSTNAEARRLSPELAGPEWILAFEQTDARGRRGRPWRNLPGNFAATLVLIAPDEPPDRLALRSFVAALALYDALNEVGARRLTLKWPNDVLLNGRKLAGILLESLPHGRLAIGIGVNLANKPDAADLEADAVAPISLAETGINVQPEAFLDHLAAAFARIEAMFQNTGFAPLRREWLAHAAKLGETITAKTGKDVHVGIFRDVDDAGNLILATEDGTRTIPAADIYF